MNKHEALKQIEEQRDMILDLHGWGVFGYIKGIINQLDEPKKIELPKVDFKKSQKVTIPQFVADWIEESKKSCENVVEFFEYRNPSFETTKWIEEGKRFDLIARAWLDGYEIEEEPKYIVKLKNACANNETLNHRKKSKEWLFSDREENSLYNTKHTRKELEEAGFGWVFNCDGVEVEEVE
jgi:hypothetical protein|nr:MAG TPA: Protein of unknown function (DUF1642) [Caudoviricetes sp.]